MTSGYNQTAWLLKDPSWSPGRSGAKWIPVSSAGVGKPARSGGSLHKGNIDAVHDLFAAMIHCAYSSTPSTRPALLSAGLMIFSGVPKPWT